MSSASPAVERLLHWVNAAGFFFLLVTGLILYLPRLSVLVNRRQLIQSLHFWAGVGWLAALAVVIVLGGRRLLATARELDTFDSDDVRWLRRREAPQGGSTRARRSTPPSPPRSPSCSGSPASCSGSASRTRATALRAPCSCTTA